MASRAFDDYRAQALAEGYDEVLVRSWPADLQIDTHTHAFAPTPVGTDGRGGLA